MQTVVISWSHSVAAWAADGWHLEQEAAVIVLRTVWHDAASMTH